MHHLFRLYIACKCNVLTHCAPLRLMILSPHTKFPVFRPQIISYHSHRNSKITPNAELPIVIHIREWNVQVLVEFEQGIPKLRLCGCPQLSFRLKHWRKHFPVLACILTIFRHKKRELLFRNSLAFKWCHRESNQGHKDFQSFALPTELWHRVWFGSAKVRVILDFAKFSSKIGENRRNAYLSGCPAG